MEPLIAQIMLFGGNFAPRGWAFCDGQLLPINTYPALFSILGTTYGGDGRTTFALPDLRGRVPAHAGNGPGLSPRQIGQMFGTETVTLMANQIPAHSHALMVSPSAEVTQRAGGGSFGAVSIYAGSQALPSVPLNGGTVAQNNGGMAHDNIQPTLCINYIIALEGIFPSRG